MTWKSRVLSGLFPAPRRPVPWWRAWTVLVFWLACLLAVLAGEWTATMSFTSPGQFAWLLLAGWFWWLTAAGWHGLAAGRARLALGLRWLLLAAIAAALAGPRAVRESDGLALIYVVDRSDSIGAAAADAALTWMVDTVRAKPQEDLAGLVVFGREAAVELPPRDAFPFEGAIASRIERGGTDLGSALTLAAALVPPGREGRLVLVSDGVATETGLDGALADLAARGIAVDALPIAYGLEREQWLEKLDLPRHVKANETYEAAVVVGSLVAAQSTIVLRENGQIVAEAPVSLRPGRNRFQVPLRLRGAGVYEYLAALAPAADEDFWEANNHATGQLHLRGEGQVLLVHDPEHDAGGVQHLAAALRAAGRQVAIADPFALPREPLGLSPYDAVLLIDVAADRLDLAQQRSLQRACYHLGIGLGMVGGGDSYGPGGWHRTPVEEALPVSMDIAQKKVLPKGALAIVLHTCEFPDGNTWGKRIAKQAIKVLGAQDEAGVLVYDHNGADWLFPLSPVADAERLFQLIEQAQIGDMPDFSSTMAAALAGLKQSDAAAKHVIIISDGDPSPPTPAQVQEFVDAQISISTVAVFPHGNMDQSMMQGLASATGGRYYFPQDPAQLPGIFIKEAKTLKRSMIQNLRFVPERGAPSPVLKGLEGLPELGGYVIASLKPGAEEVLTRTTAEEDRDPILALWQHGIGRAAAFTSDLGSNWAADWVGWEGYRPFVEQLVAHISRAERPSHLHVLARAEGDRGELLVEDHHPQGGFLDLHATIIDPEGRETAHRLDSTGPGRYGLVFPVSSRGRYQVLLAGGGDGRQEQAAVELAVAYAPEYRRFRSDPVTLRRIVDATGGRELTPQTTGEELFDLTRTPRRLTLPIVDWLLAIAACLVLADVAARRIQIDWALLFRRRAPVTSTPTLGSLLANKEKRKEAAPSPSATAPPLRSPVAGSAPPAAAARAPAAPSAAPASTMARLLARKKQLDDERKNE